MLLWCNENSNSWYKIISTQWLQIQRWNRDITTTLIWAQIKQSNRPQLLTKDHSQLQAQVSTKRTLLVPRTLEKCRALRAKWQISWITWSTLASTPRRILQGIRSTALPTSKGLKSWQRLSLRQSIPRSSFQPSIVPYSRRNKITSKCICCHQLANSTRGLSDTFSEEEWTKWTGQWLSLTFKVF